MKNAHTIDISDTLNIPPFWQKEWLQNILSELNLSTMSKKNRALFNISLARVMAIQDEFEREKKKAAQKERVSLQTSAIEKGLKRGKLTVEEIAEDNNVSVSFVLKIQAKM